MSHPLIDLSHRVEAGMETYAGLPGPLICDYWSREDSAALYDDGSSFQIGKIEMVANTGTYVDVPFHRHAHGCDLADQPLASLADLEGLVVTRPFEAGLATDAEHLRHLDVAGKAVLVATGWDRHWRTAAYSNAHPFLTRDAALWLVEQGAAFVGIDSYNIDDTSVRARPVHSALLGAGIPIGEHLTGLAQLPPGGFRFHAVPPPVEGMGTFPVRAYAVLGQ